MREVLRNLAAAGIFVLSSPAIDSGESIIYETPHTVPIASVNNALDWLGERDTFQKEGETLIIAGFNSALWWSAKRFSDGTNKNSFFEGKLLWAFPTLISTGSAVEIGLIWS